MADTSLGLGAFASGMANGMKMGMDYNAKQESAEKAKAATEQQQANSATSTGANNTAPAAGMPAFGQQQGAPAAAQPVQAAQQPGAAGSSPWSFIGSLFGGSNG